MQHFHIKRMLSWYQQSDVLLHNMWFISNCIEGRSLDKTVNRQTLKNSPLLHERFNSKRRDQLKYDGTRAETRFRLSAKRTSPFKSAGASVQWITGSRGVRISGSNAGYTMFRGSVKGTCYPLHSPVSPSLPLPCVIVCHQISNGVNQEHTKEQYPESDKLVHAPPTHL